MGRHLESPDRETKLYAVTKKKVSRAYANIYRIALKPWLFFNAKKAVKVTKPSGEKIAVTPYVAGKREGIAIMYSSEGRVSASREYHDDLLHGIAVDYFPDGQPSREARYVVGHKDGQERVYYPGGQLASVVCHKYGLLHGWSQSWNEEGILTFEAEYQEGLRHGKFNKYYPDGSPCVLQNYVLDTLHGIKECYSPDGEVATTRYETGQVIE